MSRKHRGKHESNHSRRRLFPLLMIPIVITATIIGVYIFHNEEPDVINESTVTDEIFAPDYVPLIEENAETIKNDSSTKAESPKDGGFVSLSFSDQVEIDLSEGTASLFFANPKKSNQDIVLQVVIQDHVFSQTGRLMPGNQITTASLTEDSITKLKSGKYEGKFVVFCYDPETGDRATVNTEIPIIITVKK